MKRTERVEVRFSIEDLKAIQKLADKHTAGNISEWIRTASVNYVPKKRG